jgi:hypothetical protein
MTLSNNITTISVMESLAMAVWRKDVIGFTSAASGLDDVIWGLRDKEKGLYTIVSRLNVRVEELLELLEDSPATTNAKAELVRSYVFLMTLYVAYPTTLGLILRRTMSQSTFSWMQEAVGGETRANLSSLLTQVSLAPPLSTELWTKEEKPRPSGW